MLSYALSVLSRRCWVHSHGTLVLCSFLCIGVAVVATCGIGLLFLLTLSLVVQPLSFLPSPRPPASVPS
jgi:hypothetical protein